MSKVNRYLRYLNRFLTFLWICGFGFTCGFAYADEIRGPKKVGKLLNLFGYSVTAHSNFGATNFFEYKAGGEFIQITVLKLADKEVAEIFVDDRLAQFRSVFEPRRVDYPGQYSKSIQCPMEFRPALFELDLSSGHFTYFSGYAGINRVAGACSSDLIAYRYIYGLVVCKRPIYVMEIERFTDDLDDDLENFVRKVTCEDLPIVDF